MANLIANLFNKEKREAITVRSFYGTDLKSRSTPMLLSTVYRCVDLISNNVASLPFQTFIEDGEGYKKLYREHPAFRLLDREPNRSMTRFVFFKSLMASVLLHGNGYARILRDGKGNATAINFCHPGTVSPVCEEKDGLRQISHYVVTGVPNAVSPRDMIHVLNFSYDGVIGVSTLTHAAQTLNIATMSEESAVGFLKGGGNLSGIIKVHDRRLDKQQKQQIYSEWDARMNPATGVRNGIVALDQSADYQPIQVSPRDAQLLESRLFNVSEACRFFSVSPVMAFDLSKSSYSTVEATQLAFLNDTIDPILVNIEQEFNRKIFLPSESDRVTAIFDRNKFQPADRTAQSNYVRTLFACGGITPNEIRRMNNLPRMEGGDDAFIQVNMQTLQRAVEDPKVVSTHEPAQEPDPNQEPINN